LVDQPLKTELEYHIIATNKAGEGTASKAVMWFDSAHHRVRRKN
jgi:hypothetical protein